MTKTMLIYALAALAEIAGCFGFWMWLRQGRSVWLAAAAVLCLIAFAWLLTHVNVAAAGRAYAAYGGIYIMASLVWLWAVESVRPDRWDMLGAAVCVLGAGLILFVPRAA